MQTIEQIIMPEPAEGEIVDPMTWFESTGPLEIEIGCGKGGFLLSRARSHPDVRLLGIEWANKYFKFAADRMARRGVNNVRIMRTDARTFVMNHLPPASVSVLHLYHPDPWPKKRHHKRRLVQADFVAAVTRILVPGGLWLIQTDHLDYYGWIREVLARTPDLVEIEWPENAGPDDPDWMGTNFEIKYAREGRMIYRIAVRSVPYSAGI